MNINTYMTNIYIGFIVVAIALMLLVLTAKKSAK